MAGNLNLKVCIEPICKVICMAQDCEHHLLRNYGNEFHCNRKMLAMDETGKCKNFKQKGAPDGR